MKRWLLNIGMGVIVSVLVLFFALFFGAFTNTAEAQNNSSSYCINQATGETHPLPCFAGELQVQNPDPTQAPNVSAVGTDNPNNSNQDPNGSCIGWFGGVNMKACTYKILAVISNFFLWVTSWLVWLAGVMLNKVIDYTIINMSANIRDISGINYAWTAIRDLANMSFIFILLYTAVSTVLGLGKDWRKTVINVVIAALLINFSLFFTKVIIDASNIVTLGFYDAIAASENFTRASDPWDRGLSNAFVRPLGVVGLFDEKSIDTLTRNKTHETIIIIGLSGSFFLVITSFVLFAAAFMFLIRYVVLIFLLVLSPLAFVGSVIPGVGGQAKKWWEALWGQAIFAPLFMMLIWLTLVILNDPNFDGSNTVDSIAGNAPKLAEIATNGQAIGVVMNFVIVTFFLVGSIVISKGFATKGGTVVSTLMNKATAGAGAAAFGSAAYASRNTVGRFANRISESEMLNRMAAKGKYGSKYAARFALASNKKLASSSFDMRATALGKPMGAAGGSIFGLGEQNKGGYKQALKDYAKKKKEAAESYKTNTYDTGRREVVARQLKEKKLAQAKEAEARHNEKLAVIRQSDEYKKHVADEAAAQTSQNSAKTGREAKQKELAELDRIQGSRQQAALQNIERIKRELAASEKRQNESLSFDIQKQEVDKQNKLRQELDEATLNQEKGMLGLERSEIERKQELQKEIAELAKQEAEHGKTLSEVIEKRKGMENTEHQQQAAALRASLMKEKRDQNGKVVRDKDGKVVMIEKDTNDLIKEEDLDRMGAYAEDTESRSIFNPLRLVNKKSNSVKKLTAAEEIRKSMKGKSPEQKFKDLAKEFGMKEEGGEEAKPEEKEKQEEKEKPEGEEEKKEE